MKAKIVLGVLLVILGTAFGATSEFSGEPMPPCKPKVNCQADAKAAGEPEPICLPGKPCVNGK